MSTAEACNRICALAGIDHRVVDVAPSDDPELLAVFGPTLMAIAFKLASVETPRRPLAESKTCKRLGYDPISLDDGLRRTAEWLLEIGGVDVPVAEENDPRRSAPISGCTPVRSTARARNLCPQSRTRHSDRPDTGGDT